MRKALKAECDQQRVGRSSDARVQHGFDNCFVQRTVGNNDAAVLRQLVPLSEVEWFSVDVSNGSAGFLHDESAASVVPDFFLVGLPRWQVHVNIPPAASNDGLLCPPV